MKTSITKTKWMAAGIGISLLAGSPVIADDTELLLLNPDTSVNAKPNILLILDTSGSMETLEETTLPYVSGSVYSGSCDSDRLYWTEVDVTPDCTTSTNYLEEANFHCEAATRQLNGIGRYTNTMVQYRDGGTDGQSTGPATWQSLATGYSTEAVECHADSGNHGDGRSTYLWAASGTDLSDPFTTVEGNELSWGSAPRNLSYTVYDGNYLNWKASPVTATLSRMEIMQAVIKQILSSFDNMNVGLMRFNEEDGGVVIHGVKDLDTNRQAVTDAIDDLEPDEYTPLAETMYEAALYWNGMPAYWGELVNEHLTDPVALASTEPNVYDAPALATCSKNYNILITDGKPKEDEAGALLTPALPGYANTLGRTTCSHDGEGACLDDAAEYLYLHDLDPILPGDQVVSTHTIAFAIDLPLLVSTAGNSGGQYFLADDVESLTTALTTVIADINDRTLSFTAPAVSVNTFNRTQNLNDLYISEFGARAKTHWPGNLKKFRITNRQITDANNVPAIDPTTGFFKDTVTGFWSDASDSNEVTSGGAAGKLPDPAVRKLYTNISGDDLTLATNAVNIGNLDAFIDSDLGLTGAIGEPTKENLVRWARGEDLLELNATSTTRHEMGDPLHSQPAAVVYGGSAASPDLVVYMATNDGYLHAIDGDTGEELWSFIPKELLPNLTRLYFDQDSKYKHYGIDGNLVPAVKDVNNNGIIEPSDGDFVYLVFGMRRGGNKIFALDITDKNKPEMMWDVSLPEFGETWAAPVIARMDISSVTQNDDKSVVVIGGGYDTVHDTSAHPASDDAIGAGIHILDLESGDELWRTGRDSGADLQLATMTRAIPNAVRVIDLSGNGFADRMYASDMGGRVWRFDVFNGKAPAEVITGGVMAQLGAEGTDSSDAADTRRFYNSPDVSIFLDSVQQRRYIAVSIGSGYRSHPFDLAASDKFYSIRDAHVFTKLSQEDYAAYPVVEEDDLIEVSGKTGVVVTTADRGWKFTLPANQKVLADSLTFDDQVLFVGFSPDTNAAATCGTGQGTNYLYRMSVQNGDPIVPNLSELEPELSDDARVNVLSQSGIAPSPTILFPSPDDMTCPEGTDCSPPPLSCIGLECFDPGFANNPVRTLWTQDGIE